MFKIDHFDTKSPDSLQIFGIVTFGPSPLITMISGNATENCIPLGSWLSAGHSNVRFFFQTNPTDIPPDAIDITAICLPYSLRSSKHYKSTWNHRRNFFQSDDDCYQCGPCEPGAASCTIDNDEYFYCQYEIPSTGYGYGYDYGEKGAKGYPYY